MILLFPFMAEFIKTNNFMPFLSREHIVDIDDSLMLSTLTWMMHHFYGENRKNWWLFNATSIFHPCFQCFSIFPHRSQWCSVTKHPWFIDEASMNYHWNTDKSSMRHQGFSDRITPIPWRCSIDADWYSMQISNPTVIASCNPLQSDSLGAQ